MNRRARVIAVRIGHSTRFLRAFRGPAGGARVLRTNFRAFTNRFERAAIHRAETRPQYEAMKGRRARAHAKAHGF